MNYTAVPILTHPYPSKAVERSRQLLQSMLAIFGTDPKAKLLAKMALQKYPAHAGQIAQEAVALQVDPVDLMVGNLCYDLLMGTMGCSTMALPTPEGPMLARNMDWFPAEKIAKASCLVNLDSGVIAGFAGMVGAVTGMSKRGFAFALNAVFGGSQVNGYPTLLFLRHVLDEAKSYADAVEMVANEALMSGGLVTIVGMTNDQRVIVERTTDRAVRRLPQDEVLCATNHYRAMSEPEDCGRYAHLVEFGEQQPPLEVLTHPAVLQEITSQHVVMQPATQRAEMYVPSRLLSDDVVETLSRDDVMRMLFG